MASPSTRMVVVGGVSGFFGGGALEKSPSCERVGRGGCGACQNGGCGWKRPPNGFCCCCGIARCGRGGPKNGSPQNLAAAGDGISTPAANSAPAPATPSAAKATLVARFTVIRSFPDAGSLAGTWASATKCQLEDTPPQPRLPPWAWLMLTHGLRLTAMCRRHGNRGCRWFCAMAQSRAFHLTARERPLELKRWQPSSAA